MPPTDVKRAASRPRLSAKMAAAPSLMLQLRKVALIILAAFLALPGSAQTRTPQRQPGTRRPVAHRPVKPSPVVPQPAPQPPPPPPTPEQMPPSPPQVTYQNGLLSIVAQNSTLGDILAAVRARTGATLDMPPGIGAERVVAQIGPLPPRDALTALLDGSRFNFVLLGSEQNPDGLQRIILTSPGPEVAGAAIPAPPRPGVPPPANAAGEGEEESTDDYTPPADTIEQPPPPPQPAQPVSPPAGQPQTLPGQPQAQPAPGPPQPGPNPTQPQVKTPEQLLQELQRMQQRQQQGLPPQPPPQPPTQGPPPDQNPQPPN